MPGTDDEGAQPQPEVVQVWFPMSGGPADSTGVAAEVLGADRVRLVVSPWAALNAAKGDVYRVERHDDGQLWVQEKLEPSGFCAVLVNLTDDSPSHHRTRSQTTALTSTTPTAGNYLAATGEDSATASGEICRPSAGKSKWPLTQEEDVRLTKKLG